MEISTTFRSQAAPPPPPPEVKSANAPHTPVVDVEVPYLDYNSTHFHPYAVDHYELGDSWVDEEGGFTEEVGTIEEYFKHQIEHGEMANTINSVKSRLKEIEKTNGVDKEERKTLKVGTVAAYLKFLMEVSGIKSSLHKYGSY